MLTRAVVIIHTEKKFRIFNSVFRSLRCLLFSLNATFWVGFVEGKHGALRPQKPLRLIRDGEVPLGNFLI